jgi:hypothetical protein
MKRLPKNPGSWAGGRRVRLVERPHVRLVDGLWRASFTTPDGQTDSFIGPTFEMASQNASHWWYGGVIVWDGEWES